MKSYDSGEIKGQKYLTRIYRGPDGSDNASSVLPNFSYRDRVVPGSIVSGDFVNPNPWNYLVTNVKYMRGKMTWITEYTSGSSKGGRLVTTREGCIAFNTSHKMFNTSAIPAEIVNDALSKLNSKTRGDIDLSIDLLQAGQTKKMFHAAEVSELFTRNFKGLTQLIAGVSAIRLQYVYGIKPTLQTIYDCADRATNLVINEIESFEAVSSTPVTSSTEFVATEYYGDAPFTMKRTGRMFCKYGIRLKTKGNNPAYWTSLNPASIAWEMMPYSFVVDWFIDIGSYLRNLETSLLFANSFVSGYRTEGVMYDVDGSCSASYATTASGSKSTYLIDATCSGRYRSLKRSKLTSYPSPRLPTFKADLGSQRLLNAAALLGVYLKRK